MVEHAGTDVRKAARLRRLGWNLGSEPLGPDPITEEMCFPVGEGLQHLTKDTEEVV